MLGTGAVPPLVVRLCGFHLCRLPEALFPWLLFSEIFHFDMSKSSDRPAEAHDPQANK